MNQKELKLSYLNTEDASKRLYTTPYTIRKYIRQGKIAAAKIGKNYLIKLEEIERFLQEMTFKKKRGNK